MTKLIDITSFNAIKEAEQGFDFELKHPDGTPTGAILTVLGSYSTVYQKFIKKIFNDNQREIEFAKRKGKEAPEKTIEDLQQQNLESALIRVVGWKNVKQEFSPELLREILNNNPHFVAQIIEESDNAANFTKAL